MGLRVMQRRHLMRVPVLVCVTMCFPLCPVCVCVPGAPDCDDH